MYVVLDIYTDTRGLFADYNEREKNNNSVFGEEKPWES